MTQIGQAKHEIHFIFSAEKMSLFIITIAYLNVMINHTANELRNKQTFSYICLF